MIRDNEELHLLHDEEETNDELMLLQSDEELYDQCHEYFTSRECLHSDVGPGHCRGR